MEPVSGAVVGKVTEQITENLLKFIWRQIGYVVHCNENIKKLQVEAENLRAEMETIKGRVDRAGDNAEVIEPNVKKWLLDTGVLVGEVEKIVADKGNLKCFNGWCPRIGSRRRLGKEAEEKMVDLLQLKERGNNFHLVGHRPPLTDIRLFNPTADYQGFESRAVVFNEIMEAVKKDNIYTIGIYGMAGVGKTTMAREIAKEAEDKKLFDKIVQVTISQNPDIRKVQGELADFLGLKFDQESLAGRASLLCTRFKQNGEKIFVIVDDVWGQINMEEVGIPLNGYSNGCKIVFTSRTQGVVIGEGVGVEKEFEIGALHESEAWLLFNEKLQNSIDSHPELRSVAEEVCRESGGLPLAIVTLGAALRNKKLHVWNDTLGQLKNCRGNNVQGMTQKVYRSIKLSYEFLEHTDTKACLLYCCLYPEDKEICIEDLMLYGVGRRFLLSSGDTMESARKRVHTIVDSLKQSCLLLEGDNEDLVKMHDIIRDVATTIAEEDTKIMLLVRLDGVQQHWPQEDVLRCRKTISYVLDRNEELPNVLECPELRTLNLHCSFDSTPEVPANFFKVAKELEVLCLGNMKLSTAASSISELVNIRTLCLQYCKMESLSFLKELKKLEILIINDSSIEVLPEEAVKLSQLRALYWSGWNKLISSISISSLSRLEELCISEDWESKDNAWIGELNLLCNLSELQIHIPVANANASDLQCATSLIRFKISVESHFYTFDLDKIGTRTLKLEGVGLVGWTKVLMKKADVLYLVRLKGLQKVFEDRDKEGRFLDLEFLQVEECNDEMEHGFLLPKPKWNREIIQEDQSQSAFGKLSVLRVFECRFKYLLSRSVARSLLQLQELVVHDCESIEEIVGDDEQVVGDEVLFFPQLKKLELIFLPNLRSFYASTKTKSTSQPLFNEKVSFGTLEELTVIGLENIATIWDIQFGEEGAVSILGLHELTVHKCDKLVNVILSPTHLKLQDGQESEQTDDYMIKLPKLKFIFLQDLQNLKSFYSFKLEKEEVEDKNLQMQALFSHKVSYPALEGLTVWARCRALQQYGTINLDWK